MHGEYGTVYSRVYGKIFCSSKMFLKIPSTSDGGLFRLYYVNMDQIGLDDN